MFSKYMDPVMPCFGMPAMIQTFSGSNNIHNRCGFPCMKKWAGAVDGVRFSLPNDEIVCHFGDRDPEKSLRIVIIYIIFYLFYIL